MSDRMTHELLAFAAYLNCRHVRFDDSDEQRMFDEDLEKARRAMEVAWLEAHPTKS